MWHWTIASVKTFGDHERARKYVHAAKRVIRDIQFQNTYANAGTNWRWAKLDDGVYCFAQAGMINWVRIFAESSDEGTDFILPLYGFTLGGNEPFDFLRINPDTGGVKAVNKRLDAPSLEWVSPDLDVLSIEGPYGRSLRARYDDGIFDGYQNLQTQNHVYGAAIDSSGVVSIEKEGDLFVAYRMDRDGENRVKLDDISTLASGEDIAGDMPWHFSRDGRRAVHIYRPNEYDPSPGQTYLYEYFNGFLSREQIEDYSSVNSESSSDPTSSWPGTASMFFTEVDDGMFNDSSNTDSFSHTTVLEQNESGDLVQDDPGDHIFENPSHYDNHFTRTVSYEYTMELQKLGDYSVFLGTWTEDSTDVTVRHTHIEDSTVVVDTVSEGQDVGTMEETVTDHCEADFPWGTEVLWESTYSKTTDFALHFGIGPGDDYSNVSGDWSGFCRFIPWFSFWNDEWHYQVSRVDFDEAFSGEGPHSTWLLPHPFTYIVSNNDTTGTVSDSHTVSRPGAYIAVEGSGVVHHAGDTVDTYSKSETINDDLSAYFGPRIQPINEITAVRTWTLVFRRFASFGFLAPISSFGFDIPRINTHTVMERTAKSFGMSTLSNSNEGQVLAREISVGGADVDIAASFDYLSKSHSDNAAEETFSAQRSDLRDTDQNVDWTRKEYDNDESFLDATISFSMKDNDLFQIHDDSHQQSKTNVTLETYNNDTLVSSSNEPDEFTSEASSANGSFLGFNISAGYTVSVEGPASNHVLKVYHDGEVVGEHPIEGALSLGTISDNLSEQNGYVTMPVLDDYNGNIATYELNGRAFLCGSMEIPPQGNVVNFLYRDGSEIDLTSFDVTGLVWPVGVFGRRLKQES